MTNKSETKGAIVAEPKKTILVLKEYFGLKDGQALKDFAQELRDLSTEEKEQLAEGIRNESFTY